MLNFLAKTAVIQAVPKLIDKAFEWYEKSANNGYALAQLNLGMLYELNNHKESLEKELKTIENRVYKEKRVLNEHIKTLQIELINLKTKCENLKERKISDEKLFLDELRIKNEIIQTTISKFDVKIKDIKGVIISIDNICVVVQTAENKVVLPIKEIVDEVVVLEN